MSCYDAWVMCCYAAMLKTLQNCCRCMSGNLSEQARNLVDSEVPHGPVFGPSCYASRPSDGQASLTASKLCASSEKCLYAIQLSNYIYAGQYL
jgi:hypothetical protein